MYVVFGQKDDRLKSDLKLIVEKMNLKCPLLLVSHEYEKKLFNEFYCINLKSDDSTRKVQAKLFLEKNHCNDSKATVNDKMP